MLVTSIFLFFLKARDCLVKSENNFQYNLIFLVNHDHCIRKKEKKKKKKMIKLLEKKKKSSKLSSFIKHLYNKTNKARYTDNFPGSPHRPCRRLSASVLYPIVVSLSKCFSLFPRSLYAIFTGLGASRSRVLSCSSRLPLPLRQIGAY